MQSWPAKWERPLPMALHYLIFFHIYSSSTTFICCVKQIIILLIIIVKIRGKLYEKNKVLGFQSFKQRAKIE